MTFSVYKNIQVLSKPLRSIIAQQFLVISLDLVCSCESIKYAWLGETETS